MRDALLLRCVFSIGVRTLKDTLGFIQVEWGCDLRNGLVAAQTVIRKNTATFSTDWVAGDTAYIAEEGSTFTEFTAG